MVPRVPLTALLLSLALSSWAADFTNPVAVPETWPDYGIGDPFILRFNGAYYLYCSTRDSHPGIRVWQSTDLLTWEPKGLCTDDPVSTGAYAPEVTYWNGWFWLSTSPAGTGHRLYRGRSPLGPFERFTDNIGLTIDGSWFRDEDGKLYFYHASPRGILGHEVAADGTMGPEHLLEGTWMGHWTEGPSVIRHGNLWFLFLTGNHVFSDGYRENYAVSTVGPLGPFVQPADNPLALSTAPDFRGLGHGSPVRGPDLVSWWLVYHNLVGPAADGPPIRDMNLDQLIFDGPRVQLLGPSRGPRPRPESALTVPRPASAPHAWTSEATALALPQGARFAGTPGSGQGWRVVFDPRTNEIRLETPGTSPLVRASAPLFNGFDFTVAHTLRLEAGPGGLTAWVDGWKAWQTAWTPPSAPSGWEPAAGFQPGWWGWTPGSEAEAADRAVYPLPGILNPGRGGPVAGPWERTYAVRVAQAGAYTAIARVTGARPQGTELLVDGRPLVPAHPAPGLEPAAALTAVELGTVELPAGDHTLTVKVPGTAGLAWDSLDVQPAARPTDPVPEPRNHGLFGWVGPDNGRDGRYLVTLERRSSGPDLYGLLVRTSQYSRHPDQVADGYLGYKISLSGGRVTVTRVQYERRIDLGSAEWKAEVGVPVRLEVRMVGSTLSVGPAGAAPWLTVTDPLPLASGPDGWYASSGRVRFTDPVWEPWSPDN